MDFALDPEQEALRDAVRDVMQRIGLVGLVQVPVNSAARERGIGLERAAHAVDVATFEYRPKAILAHAGDSSRRRSSATPTHTIQMPWPMASRITSWTFMRR